MQNTETIHLDGRVYLSTKYPATAGFRLFIKLVKLLGEAVFKFLFFGEVEELKDLLKADVNEVLVPILEKLEPEESLALVNQILETTTITAEGKNRPLNFDLDFAGRYLHLLKLVGKVVGYQYADFFTGNASSEKPGAENKIKALK